MAVKQATDPAIARAAIRLRELQADETARRLYENRIKLEWQMQAHYDEGRAEEKAQGIRNALAEGLDRALIARLFSIAEDDIDSAASMGSS